MKTTKDKMKLPLYAALVALTAILTINSSNALAEDDMMGTMPAQQQPAQPMQPDPADPAAADHDHDQMEEDHKQMKKDHKKMKKDAAAKPAKKPMKMKKQQTAPAPMNSPDPGMGGGHM